MVPLCPDSDPHGRDHRPCLAAHELFKLPPPLGAHDLEPQMGKSGPVSTAPAKPRLARLRLRFMDSLKAPLSVVRTVTPGSFSREPARRETWWTHRKEVFRCFSPDSDASPR